ncbi:MAG TPA: hypothetical protein VFR23_01090 [Jiangellaceae bacterium]|nr:hypothetical protein [Jiangellaceae bacterium]
MIREIVVWAGRVVLVSTMLLAGVYTFYYLYYWQWVRAQIAGTLFVATLVIGATWLILGRMKHLERDIARRLDAAKVAVVPNRSADLPEAATAPDGTPTSQPDFPWLAPEFSPPRHQVLVPIGLAGAAASVTGHPRTAVFIPVLLGAGLVVSLVAALAERTAAAAYASATPARAVRQLLIGGLAAVVAVSAVVAGIWWAAHYRPVARGEGQTELTVQVSSRVASLPTAADTVEIVGRYCALNAILGVQVLQVEADAPDSAVLIVSPVLDEEAQRRYGGCLQDAILEDHRLSVTKTVLVAEEDTP